MGLELRPLSLMLLSGVTPHGLSVSLFTEDGGHRPGPTDPRDPEGPFFSDAFGLQGGRDWPSSPPFSLYPPGTVLSALFLPLLVDVLRDPSLGHKQGWPHLQAPASLFLAFVSHLFTVAT